MSDARTKASRKWNEANLERIYITVPIGDKAEIKAAADAAGEKVNGYIKQAIAARMDKEGR